MYASLPLFAGVIGDTVGGVATDWLLKRTGSAKIGRRVVAIVGLLGCAVCIVPAALTENAYVAVYGLTASMFFLEFTIGPSWAVPMDTGGKYSGTVSGMMNMAGNFGGAHFADRVRRIWRKAATGRRRSSLPPACWLRVPPCGHSGSTPTNTSCRAEPRPSGPQLYALINEA